jgi:hypothetical protein
LNIGMLWEELKSCELKHPSWMLMMIGKAI